MAKRIAKSKLDALVAIVKEIWANPATLVKLSNDFKKKLKTGYKNNPCWKRVINIVTSNENLETNAAKLPYQIKDTLIYYKNPNLRNYLCIPRDKELLKQGFSQVHDKIGHVGYAQAHQPLFQGLYICHMAKLLRKYLHHCPKSQLQMTPRHSPYGSLQPIILLPRPFYTILIDSILALPTASKGFNSAMLVTDKYNKQVTFIVGKISWEAKKWAIKLFDQLNQVDWELPSAILLDCIRLFVAKLWKAIFKKLKVDLLFSTTYQAQTNCQSEQSIQTAEIALRHPLPDLNSKEQWPKALPQLQVIINNSQNTNSTELSPNEVIYSFQTKESIDLFPHKDQEVEPGPIWTYRPLRTDAKDAIAFAQMAMKDQYNRRHTPRFFEVGDQINLRFHQDYTLQGITNRKTSQQFVGPLTILKRVRKLAYRLKIPPIWKIHPVILVAH